MSVNVETNGSMVPTCIGLSEPIGGALAPGELHDLTVEPDKGQIYPVLPKESEIIAVITDTPGIAGHVGSDLQRNRGRLVSAL